VEDTNVRCQYFATSIQEQKQPQHVGFAHKNPSVQEPINYKILKTLREQQIHKIPRMQNLLLKEFPE
jgi:hypothetical protein